MGRQDAHTVQLLWEMKSEFPTLWFLSKVGLKAWPHLVFPFLSSSLSKPRALPSLQQPVWETACADKGRLLLWVSATVPAPGLTADNTGWHICSEELAYRTQRSTFLIIILSSFSLSFHLSSLSFNKKFFFFFFCLFRATPLAYGGSQARG